VLLVFVMSNVVLAVKVIPNLEPFSQCYAVEYSFHIELRHLECAHFTWGSDVNGQRAIDKEGSAACVSGEGSSSSSSSSSAGGESSSGLLLRDTSISAMFLSLLGQNSVSERVIFAPNIETKERWLRFLTDCIEMHRAYDCGAADQAERTRMLRKALPTCRRVSTKRHREGIWSTE
jgi:hypothetical protein